MVRITLTGILVLLSAAAQDAAAQRRTPGQPTAAGEAGSTEVSIIARVGTKSYTSRVPGTCKHEPSASIYDVPAALWMVQGDGSDGSEIKQLSFTLWRPKNGSADQVSVSLEAGSSSTRIDVNPRAKPVGTATVQLQPVGTGGKFELKGKDAKGTRVDLTISCPVFAAVEAAGG
jgi:hypothetical protein